MIHGSAGRDKEETSGTAEDIASNRVRQLKRGQEGEEKKEDARNREGKRRVVPVYHRHIRMRVHNSFRERLLLYTVYSGGHTKGSLHMATRGD